jgi:hypothetical protein
MEESVLVPFSTTNVTVLGTKSTLEIITIGQLKENVDMERFLVVLLINFQVERLNNLCTTKMAITNRSLIRMLRVLLIKFGTKKERSYMPSSTRKSSSKTMKCCLNALLLFKTFSLDTPFWSEIVLRP